MSHLTPKASNLQSDWNNLHTGAGQAIAWLESTRASSERLNRDADELILRMRRARNIADGLAQASVTPMTIGVFGASQVGKSYLISSLAAGENGLLETTYDGQRIDFMKHINPVGGSESTGLVTRFSPLAKAGPTGFPVELQVFAEVDIIKILANSYFMDFDQNKVAYQLSDKRLRQVIAQAQPRVQAQPYPGMSADDCVSLWDYINTNYPKVKDILEQDYWPAVLRLAPYLTQADRAQLFSPLWGEIAELSDAYASLASMLDQLGHPTKVYAPLAALVSPNAQGVLTQDNNIMAVSTLRHLGSPHEKRISVCPWVGAAESGSLQAAVPITVGYLAAITRELTFPLEAGAWSDAEQTVDLLDFPGYRARMSISSMDELAKADSSGEQQGNPVSRLILRGKVAFLFQRYTDRQEMNGLILCLRADANNEANFGEELNRWIEQTQGATPEERSRRQSGLLWMTTRFDELLESNLKKDESLFGTTWSDYLYKCFAEHFEKYEWLENWSTHQPLNNVFLVRKPGMAHLLFDVDQNNHDKELGLRSEYQHKLTILHQNFVNSADINKRIANASQAWDAMMALNDGGMSRIRDYVAGISDVSFKLGRIQDQFTNTYHHIVDQALQPWYKSGADDDAKQKQQLMAQFQQQLPSFRPIFAELLRYLSLPAEFLCDLYQRVGESNDDSYEQNGAFPISTVEEQYVHRLYQEWLKHLRQLPGSAANKNVLKMPEDLLNALVEEIISTADRLQLQQRLLDALTRRRQHGARRAVMAERQGRYAAMTLSNFVSYLDQKSPADESLFTVQSSFAPDGTPYLPEAPQDHGTKYLQDWIQALCQQTLDNAGHEGGRELSLEQNSRLGEILACFSAASLT
ncbi:virulence factor SrfC family protein [Alcaligenes endophyticus]|uniref:Virulence factor n=1 Tax=Alcaligenes endophyticus TaxID=1929088 RepID=A0ABT8ELG1_9BURK|nr:virulence factor SrfC family protein [Alcaligenes endophyticus]MCX5590586.1 virulence factor SrfC family protein [Alcaligenes endophyticus]MDN4122050.1 putative virulence factor [Alcaligenes endophyticus]